MFCPGCGLQELQRNQFCRACGTDLRSVRFALERPDNITASAVSARDEIGRAVAAKIRETESASELKKIAEDVLPEMEKFLESPEEKRVRQIRKGTIVSSIGIGGMIGFTVASLLMADSGVFFFVGAGIVMFFIGLGMILNALLFTVPKKRLPDKSTDAQNQRELDLTEAETNELQLPEPNHIFTSVTEETTRHLKEKQPLPRD
ncbi:MAG TPA: hypothetical protein VK892_20405 [Pyrinomonadaceae bacterium]|nr:hypothetical protein [Pyrinomonadaceae bacterium]